MSKPRVTLLHGMLVIGLSFAFAQEKRAVVSGDPARLERIHKATMPKIDKAIPFDTPEADAICSALEVLPPNNPWNLVVEDWPLHPNSKNIIASIGPTKPLPSSARFIGTRFIPT